MHLPLDRLLFWNETVSVTGGSPYEEHAISKIVRLEGGIIGDKDIWQTHQIVVVGRKAFDEDYLIESREFGIEHGFTCRYLSQEDFWQFWLSGEETTYYADDPKISEHEGLSFLASIGFKWPSIEAAECFGGTGSLAGRLRDQHELKRIFGYSVRQDVAVEERRQSLKRAIRRPPSGLGLRAVAEHIAGMASLNSSRYDDRMQEAIDRWKSDLEWLRQKYYVDRYHSFLWPSAG